MQADLAAYKIHFSHKPLSESDGSSADVYFSTYAYMDRGSLVRVQGSLEDMDPSPQSASGWNEEQAWEWELG